MTNTVSTATDDVELLVKRIDAHCAARQGDKSFVTEDLLDARATLRALVQERDRLREALRDIARDASIKISEEIEWRITKARAALGE